MKITCPHCQHQNDFDPCQLPWEDGESHSLTCILCQMPIWIVAIASVDHKTFKTEEEMDNR